MNAWNKASPSIVSVLPTWPGFKKPGFGAPPGTAPEGTGIVITTSGHILTASHVISRAKKIEIRDINGNKFDADLIFNDIKTDLAIIKAEIKYQIAMQELESKYDDDTSKLEREKDHIYRQILDRAKNDPDKLDRLLEEMGINEVKKS